ncbi:MAG: lipid-A-disaccharide synthase [Phycisphaerales bacterium]|nr:lipid-A-disaccharide synthase [Phycisphaerales bacterium]
MSHQAERPPVVAPEVSGVLFTAFEPSGDDHAAAVVRELRARHPTLPIYAWGGPKMAAAGATLVERTGEDAVMGVPGLAKVREHQRINRRVRAWLERHPEVRLVVPVDSPAANFPICRIARSMGLRIVHLVAPQVWAWGGWRIHKLRRLTDLLLCLLPFEQEWFRERGIPARFIGHPLFDRPLDRDALDEAAAGLPQGSPCIALMPGSRPAEIAKNFPLLLGAFRAIGKAHEGAVGVVAATTPAVEQRLRAIAAGHGGWPDSLSVVSGRADAVIHWCELALVVSGTVTLQIARQQRPMVIVYRSNPLVYLLLARWVLSTEFFTLPNLIAGREIVPELVPHFAGPEPIAEHALRLLADPSLAARQRAEMARIAEKFAGRHAARSAADAIEQSLGLVSLAAETV